MALPHCFLRLTPLPPHPQGSRPSCAPAPHEPLPRPRRRVGGGASQRLLGARGRGAASDDLGPPHAQHQQGVPPHHDHPRWRRGRGGGVLDIAGGGGGERVGRGGRGSFPFVDTTWASPRCALPSHPKLVQPSHPKLVQPSCTTYAAHICVRCSLSVHLTHLRGWRRGPRAVDFSLPLSCPF